MAKHFVIKVQGGNFTFRRDEELIRSEERQDGLYVIRTSESAERLSACGFALRDWRGVMSALASQCRTTVEAGGIPVSMDTEPTAYQAEVFRLLSAKSPVWGGVPRNRNENWAGGNAPAPLK